MRKINNFAFVPNVQQGACLLFDRKGLGRRQVYEFNNNLFVKNVPYLFQVSKNRMTKNIKHLFSAAM